jgi:hypothetical protein
MAVKKEKFVYYTFQYLPIIEKIFTKSAREKFYFIGEDNKLYFFEYGTHIQAPFLFMSEVMRKDSVLLYPFGTTIANKNNNKECGEIVSYDLGTKYYILDNKQRISFNSAVVTEYYYFISSTGKVQRDVVGRDLIVDTFRKKTNNFFETKEKAMEQLETLNN